MDFLSPTQCQEWCHSHGVATPREVSRSEFQAQFDFKIPKDAGARVVLCRVLWDLTAIDDSERLLWVTGWGIWEEHQPLFYRLREALRETRNLRDAPGHVVGPRDNDDGLSILVVAALFLWDCWLYSSTAIVEISNDEVGTFFQRQGHPQDVRAILAEFAK
jgi:hypothetical protein